MKPLKRLILKWLGIPHDTENRLWRLEIRQMGLDPDDPMLGYVVIERAAVHDPRRKAVIANLNAGDHLGL